jgi:hypothetical protein
VSTSLVDDEGVDLVFHPHDGSTTLAVQVKSRSMTAKAILNHGRFIANVGASTFRPRDDLHMLFVAVDTGEGTIEMAWLVPSEVFAAKTKTSGKNRHRFVASLKHNSKDQWSEFRFGRAELAQRILDVLARSPCAVDEDCRTTRANCYMGACRNLQPVTHILPTKEIWSPRSNPSAMTSTFSITKFTGLGVVDAGGSVEPSANGLNLTAPSGTTVATPQSAKRPALHLGFE